MRFVYCRIKGSLSVYEYLSIHKTVFAARDNAPLIEIAGNIPESKSSRKEKLAAFYQLISDFPDLLDQFKNSDQKEEDIVTTVGLYNKYPHLHKS